MKVLVVGTLPPPGGPSAKRLANLAAALVADGHVVETLSPDPRSASHSYLPLAGPMLAARVALRARRFDAIVLNLEPGLPLASAAGRLTRAVTLASLGEAMRGYTQVTIRLPNPIPIPGGVGGRASRALWERATSVVLEHPDDLDRMLAAPGISVERIVVDVPGTSGTASDEPSWRKLTGSEANLREAVQTVVRARAARDRVVNGARSELGAIAALATPGDPFAATAPARLAARPVEIARLVLARSRRIAVRWRARRRR
ncbi:MAG TPA: hypothetical protein VND23_05165 [Acidimicrobiales bacterium]|nr:hypothetical protein [Acidimicrobiales bacterium]